MPCYERRVVNAKISAMDLGILRSALEANGFKITDQTQYYAHTNDAVSVLHASRQVGLRIDAAVIYSGRDGSRRIQTEQATESLIDEIKRIYAEGVIQEVARYGWDIEVDGDTFTLQQQGTSDGW